MRHLLVWLGLIGAVLGAPVPVAQAFSRTGHDAMEALAYRRLLARARHGTDPSGREMLRFLIREQVLDRPPCFEPGSEERESCAEDWTDDPLRWWPVVRSSEPDNVLYRQFGSDGQCYHFMARAEDVIDSEREIEPGVPELLATRAYARCMRLVDALIEDAVQDPARAETAVTGAYALMHIVADSFSAAHAARDGRDRVRYLKPWRMRTWGRYILHPSAWQYHVGSTHHHVYSDPRDQEWLATDAEGDPRPGCDERTHPYAIGEHCLSARGLRVVAALEELLVVLYRLRLERVSGTPRGAAAPSPHWRAFRQRTFPAAPGRAFPMPRGAREPERIAEGGIGVNWEHEYRTGAESVFLVERSLPLRPRELHLGQFFSPQFGIGARREAGKTQLLMTLDLALWFPLSGEIAVGVVPLSLRGVAGDAPEVSFGAIPLRVDLAVASYLWIGLTPLRLEWIPGSTGFSTASGLTLGVTLDSPARTTALRGWDRIADELGNLGRGQPGPPGDRSTSVPRAEAEERARGAWTTPPLPHTFDPPDRWLVLSSAGASRPRYETATTTISAVTSLIRVGRHWSYGDVSTLGASLRIDVTSGEEGMATAGLGPMLRLYLVPDALAVEATMLAEIGAPFARGPIHLDLTAQPAVVLSAFGLELLVDLPRYSALGNDEAQRIGIGARVGTAW